MQKLTIKNTGILGIKQLDYIYNHYTDSVLLVVTHDKIIPKGKEVFEKLCREFPEAYIPLVRSAACMATGITEEVFESKLRKDEAVYARGMFWRYLVLEKGFSDSRAAKAGGKRDRITVRHSVNKDMNYLIPTEKIWEEKFDLLLKEQGLRVRSEIMGTSEQPPKS